MRRTIHICVSISGSLRRTNKELAGMMDDENGRPLTGREVRDQLRYAQAMGKKVLPVGDPCEGFSYETGCPGHPVEEEVVNG